MGFRGRSRNEGRELNTKGTKDTKDRDFSGRWTLLVFAFVAGDGGLHEVGEGGGGIAVAFDLDGVIDFVFLV